MMESIPSGFTTHFQTIDTMGDDTIMSAGHQSIVSHFSAAAGLKSCFEWFFSSSTSSSSTPHTFLSEAEWKEKEALICATLNGNSDGVVDLWKLRELALSPGGLLCPYLRRRAWPILVGSHEHVLSVALNSHPTTRLVTPSTRDTKALKHDVSKTMWGVEDYLAASRDQQRMQDEKLEHILALQREQNKKVTFSPLVKQGKQQHQQEQQYTAPATPPETIATTPVSSDDGGESLLSNDHEEEEDGNSLSGGGTDENTSTSFTFSSNHVFRNVTNADQKILYNIILSLLRTEAEPNDNFEDDNFHYYSGLQDLCALLTINLESPSLTSLVLTRLAGSHLRDALRTEHRVLIDAAIGDAFLPLLEAVDAGLYQHLQRRHGMTTLPTSITHKWIACWFAQDIPDAAVASRLADVFLVSHPFMPLYVSVALFTRQRSQIVDCQDLSTLYSLFRELPVQTLFEQENRMSNVETVIATALSYMKQIPPSALVESVKNRSPDVSHIIPCVAMYSPAPEWSLRDEAPSDYALLQRAKALRYAQQQQERGEYKEAHEESEEEKDIITTFHQDKRMDSTWRDYPLAVSAVGYAPRGSFNKQKRASLVLLFFFTCSVAFLFMTISTPLTRRSVVVKQQVVPLALPRRSRKPIFSRMKLQMAPATINSVPNPSPVRLPSLSLPRFAVGEKALKRVSMTAQEASSSLMRTTTTIKNASELALKNMLQAVRIQLEKIRRLWKKLLSVK